MNIEVSPYSKSKIFYHQDLLAKVAKGDHVSPLYIRIKPTNKCNHNCSYCHYKNSYLDLNAYDPNVEIPRDKMMETIDCLADMGVKAVTFSGGGEPLIYPYIEETFEKVLENGIELSIITNGSMLKGRKAELLASAKWVRISIESSNDDMYSEIRGIKKGSFTELCDNIKKFATIKNDDCELGVNVVVNEANHNEIKQLASLMKSLGVNHVKFAPLISNNTIEYHRPFMNQVIADLKQLQGELTDDKFNIIDLYTGDFDNAVIFERKYHNCPIKEMVCVIAANSKVYYCHDKAYLNDGEVCDISSQSFKEGWNSAAVIEKFKNFDARVICKQHCVYDARNELINNYFKDGAKPLELGGIPKHVNFI